MLSYMHKLEFTLTICLLFFLMGIWPLPFRSLYAQERNIVTKSFPLEFDESFSGNSKWQDPLKIIDDNLETYSSPRGEFAYDEQGFYYILHLRRPYKPGGELLDQTDYGEILKVQIKLVYGLMHGVKLNRFSFLEVEGYIRRLENVGVRGAGLDQKIVEIIDVTKAQSEWSFTDPYQWDEIILRFSSSSGGLNDLTFNLYEVQLLVTYLQKRSNGG